MTQLTLGLPESRKRRDAGIATVAAKNESLLFLLREKARQIAEERGTVSIDEIRKYMSEQGLHPTHRNAIGAIFRCKDFECVGFKQSEIESNHARVIAIWKIRK